MHVGGGPEKMLNLTSDWGPRSEEQGPGLPCPIAGGRHTTLDAGSRAGVGPPRWAAGRWGP